MSKENKNSSGLKIAGGLLLILLSILCGAGVVLAWRDYKHDTEICRSSLASYLRYYSQNGGGLSVPNNINQDSDVKGLPASTQAPVFPHEPVFPLKFVLGMSGLCLFFISYGLILTSDGMKPPR
jgi:hypothetical protein